MPTIVSMMQGVVERGTGIAVAAVGKPIAGKTGTTSDWFDAWFVGFSPGLVAGVYVGFDEPRTLGDGETGGHVAAPIFRDFMTEALKDAPAKPFNQAPGASDPRWRQDRVREPPDKNTGEKSEKWAQKKLAKQLAAQRRTRPARTHSAAPATTRPPPATPTTRPRLPRYARARAPRSTAWAPPTANSRARLPGYGAGHGGRRGYAPNYAPPNYAPPGYSAPS